MIKEKVILFGASTLGIRAYENLKNIYEILFFCDNDLKKWNQYVNGIKVISPKELNQYKNLKVFITSIYVGEISEQLEKLKISNYEIFKPHGELNAKFKNTDIYNYSYKNIHEIYKNISNTNSNSIKKVLFVQSVPDIRTQKIAKILLNKGIVVDIAYLYKHPAEVYKDININYNKIIKINDLNEFVEKIKQSDYDIIHSSNEPDFLTTLLLAVNKPLAYDCHDMSSLYGRVFDGDRIHEYVSNKLSHGNIYVDIPIMNTANEKFRLKNKSIFLLNNYVLEEQLPKTYLSKLSEIDGEIHCVYEGGLSNDYTSHRYLENKFKLIANEKIHIHYYTVDENKYFHQLQNQSSYLHWEGIVSPKKLIEEMTKYDIGLILLNINEDNIKFLSTTFPNKAWEYLAAGLPMLVEDLPILRKFVSDMNVGCVVYDEKNIKEYVSQATIVEIEKNFLKSKKLLMNDFADYLINFYCKIKNQFLRKVM